MCLENPLNDSDDDDSYSGEEDDEDRDKEPFEGNPYVFDTHTMLRSSTFIKSNYILPGIISLDEAAKKTVDVLAQQTIARYRKQMGKREPDHPMNNLEATLAEEKEVNRLLILAGYKNPDELSKCVRAGLIRGHFGFKFTGEASQLDTIVREGKCSEFNCDEECSGTLKATVRKLLEQQDYGGNDYENNSEEASVKCTRQFYFYFQLFVY